MAKRRHKEDDSDSILVDVPATGGSDRLLLELDLDRPPPPDPKDPEEVHEAGRRLGERSGEVRRQRRRAPVIPTPTYPTVSDTPTHPRTPWWLDPPRLPGRKRR